MPVLSAEQLRDIGFKIFRSAGAPEEEARIVSDSLVDANLAGHDSHGVIRIPQYVGLVLNDMVRLPSRTEIVAETETVAVIDAHWGFGQVTATRGMAIAIEKARRHSIGSVSIRRSNHIGRIGQYSEMAAKAGMIGMVTVNNHGAGLLVPPWGGRERRLSSNPISFCIPTGSDDHILLDISTSVSAEGKVRVKRNRGEKIPDGWVIDHEGKSSNDPNDLYGKDGNPPGALLPMGGSVGYKGFGLSFVFDILAGALSGAGCSGAPNSRIGNSVFMLALNVEHYTDRASFNAEIDRFRRYVKSSALMPGFDEILVPGEPERRTREKREREGILVDEVTWQQIIESAERVDARILEGEKEGSDAGDMGFGAVEKIARCPMVGHQREDT